MAFKQPNLSPLILERFLGILGVAFQFNRSLGFHLVRWRVKVQQILSTRSWGSKPSLLSGFITIVGEVHIKTIMVYFNFLNFFAILLQISITRREGTKRIDNFYFLSFSKFSNKFWMEMKPKWYFLIFWIFWLFFWTFLLRVE